MYGKYSRMATKVSSYKLRRFQMKKLIFVSLSLFLVFSHSQNLNLNSLKAEPVSCIENNPHVAKILDACQNNSKFAQEKMSKVGKKIKEALMRMCTLTEKLELRGFTKIPTLFEKLFSEFIRNVAGLLNIEYEKIQSFTRNIQLNNEKSAEKNNPATLKCADKTPVENLVDEILKISGDKLDISISLIMQFLNPSSDERIDHKEIKRILTQTLSTFTPEELDALAKVIRSNAFAKIAAKLDELTEIVLSIIKEEDINSTVK